MAFQADMEAALGQIAANPGSFDVPAFEGGVLPGFQRGSPQITRGGLGVLHPGDRIFGPVDNRALIQAIREAGGGGRAAPSLTVNAGMGVDINSLVSLIVEALKQLGYMETGYRIATRELDEVGVSL